MPPKASSAKKTDKASLKATAKFSQATPEEAVAAATANLTAKVEQLEAERKAAQEARNYAELERDKVADFWDITKQEVRELQALLRQKERDVEGDEDKHQAEVKVYKQKVKHLLYEHQSNVEALKLGTEVAVKNAVDACDLRQAALAEDKAALKRILREQKGEMDAALLRSRMGSAKELSKIKSDAATSAKEMAVAYDARLAAMQSEIEARAKSKAEAAEDAQNLQIQELIREQTSAYEEMRSFFNDIVTSSLDLIKALKADAVELQRKEAAAVSLAHELAIENKNLKDPLQQAQAETEKLHARLAAAEGAGSEMQATLARLAAAKKQIKDLEWKNEVLEQRQQLLDESSRREKSPVRVLSKPAVAN